MARLLYSARALEDFERLVSFLGEVAPESAARSFEDIVAALRILESHPLIGRRIEGNYRELVVSRGAGGYLAMYAFDPPRGIVRVLRIRHQREAGYID